jgi:hypothetical protein
MPRVEAEWTLIPLSGTRSLITTYHWLIDKFATSMAIESSLAQYPTTLGYRRYAF